MKTAENMEYLLDFSFNTPKKVKTFPTDCIQMIEVGADGGGDELYFSPSDKNYYKMIGRSNEYYKFNSLNEALDYFLSYTSSQFPGNTFLNSYLIKYSESIFNELRKRVLDEMKRIDLDNGNFMNLEDWKIMLKID